MACPYRVSLKVVKSGQFAWFLKKQAKCFVQHHTHKVYETFCPVLGVELFVSVMESVELCVQEYVRVSAASPSVTAASRFTVGPSPTVWSSPAYAAG